MMQTRTADVGAWLARLKGYLDLEVPVFVAFADARHPDGHRHRRPLAGGRAEGRFGGVGGHRFLGAGGALFVALHLQLLISPAEREKNLLN